MIQSIVRFTLPVKKVTAGFTKITEASDSDRLVIRILTNLITLCIYHIPQDHKIN